MPPDTDLWIAIVCGAGVFVTALGSLATLYFDLR
jgi:hypothetical protein